jgi:hypothetical protein
LKIVKFITPSDAKVCMAKPESSCGYATGVKEERILLVEFKCCARTAYVTRPSKACSIATAFPVTRPIFSNGKC